jgi:hypothetical protein
VRLQAKKALMNVTIAKEKERKEREVPHSSTCLSLLALMQFVQATIARRDAVMRKLGAAADLCDHH